VLLVNHLTSQRVSLAAQYNFWCQTFGRIKELLHDAIDQWFGGSLPIMSTVGCVAIKDNMDSDDILLNR
jgi:hypothetical protein